ncbi:uncharacterized protein LOC120422428 [Culex pipiens pallens]|uniref:uncharacterized protein LOC120422428 n=1 Tax=Culex pipiens pallens TaxID=42434 RepID=UPI001954C233|nr:uncharacterized protein LOC120422428 [Culex pipiens pallens]
MFLKRSQRLFILITLLTASTASGQSSEYVYGSYLPNMTPCFSSSINRNAFSAVPVYQAFTFAQAAGTVRYIRVWNDGSTPFSASVLAGGVGTAAAATTSILVSSLHGGKLSANILAMCN